VAQVASEKKMEVELDVSDAPEEFYCAINYTILKYVLTALTCLCVLLPPNSPL